MLQKRIVIWLFVRIQCFLIGNIFFVYLHRDIYLLHSSDVFLVLDSTKDDRFKNNPLVTGPPYVIFYAGAAIKINGEKVGSLCIIDNKKRDNFTIEDQQTLLDFGEIISQLFVAKRKEFLRSKHQNMKHLLSLTHNLKTPLMALDMTVKTFTCPFDYSKDIQDTKDIRNTEDIKEVNTKDIHRMELITESNIRNNVTPVTPVTPFKKDSSRSSLPSNPNTHYDQLALASSQCDLLNAITTSIIDMANLLPSFGSHFTSRQYTSQGVPCAYMYPILSQLHFITTLMMKSTNMNTNIDGNHFESHLHDSSMDYRNKLLYENIDSDSKSIFEKCFMSESSVHQTYTYPELIVVGILEVFSNIFGHIASSGTTSCKTTISFMTYNCGMFMRVSKNSRETSHPGDSEVDSRIKSKKNVNDSNIAYLHNNMSIDSVSDSPLIFRGLINWSIQMEFNHVITQNIFNQISEKFTRDSNIYVSIGGSKEICLCVNTHKIIYLTINVPISIYNTTKESGKNEMDASMNKDKTDISPDNMMTGVNGVGIGVTKADVTKPSINRHVSPISPSPRNAHVAYGNHSDVNGGTKCLNVLICSSNAIASNNIKEMVEVECERNCTTVTATNGKLALSYIMQSIYSEIEENGQSTGAGEVFDIVFLDLMLPIITGLHLLRSVKQYLTSKLKSFHDISTCFIGILNHGDLYYDYINSLESDITSSFWDNDKSNKIRVHNNVLSHKNNLQPSNCSTSERSQRTATFSTYRESTRRINSNYSNISKGDTVYDDEVEETTERYPMDPSYFGFAYLLQKPFQQDVMAHIIYVVLHNGPNDSIANNNNSSNKVKKSNSTGKGPSVLLTAGSFRHTITPPQDAHGQGCGCDPNPTKVIVKKTSSSYSSTTYYSGNNTKDVNGVSVVLARDMDSRGNVNTHGNGNRGPSSGSGSGVIGGDVVVSNLARESNTCNDPSSAPRSLSSSSSFVASAASFLHNVLYFQWHPKMHAYVHPTK